MTDGFLDPILSGTTSCPLPSHCFI